MTRTKLRTLAVVATAALTGIALAATGGPASAAPRPPVPGSAARAADESAEHTVPNELLK
jgi:hypothetical protein